MPQFMDREEEGKNALNDILLESFRSQNYTLALDMAYTLCVIEPEAIETIDDLVEQLEKDFFGVEDMSYFLESGKQFYEALNVDIFDSHSPKRFSRNTIRKALNLFRRSVMQIVWRVEQGDFEGGKQKKAVDWSKVAKR